MYHPPHPGSTIKEDILPALGVTVTEAAEQLGVTRVALSRVINGKTAISRDMALRIEKWLGVKNGGRAEVWLNQQARFNQWQIKRMDPRKQ
ncbi:HigA family addiction module antitoxin [Polynucleobacter sp. CS-Odin-A6]|uniref:HigA family addiction module antitoxin n=1 Tax=Polynucleobacter sp. CS-Odin-A6 TaxID=2689106 RepID=UPI001C0B6CDF|nr:HigA family addiction module antitoxin [Polynucleobacter sp. CS-Odin-A6]MBU3621147.1 HigA family addiction module antidote protein [Polynucleobacter sp. CS-Odin-A6]